MLKIFWNQPERERIRIRDLHPGDVFKYANGSKIYMVNVVGRNSTYIHLDNGTMYSENRNVVVEKLIGHIKIDMVKKYIDEL